MKKLFTKLILLLLVAFITESVVIATPINTFISNVSPGSNTHNSAKSENIVIYFSQSMTPSTINNSGLKIFGSETGLMVTNVIYDIPSNTAVVDPAENFKTGEQINVILESSIKTSTNISIDPVSYYFNIGSDRGDGIFNSESISQEDLKPNEIISGDFDNDGAIDLMTLNKESRKVAFIKNNGSGIFSLNSTFEVDPYGVKAFTAADFDGDGDLDLAFILGVYFSFSVQIYSNNGNGDFSVLPYQYIWTGRVGTKFLQSADLDNDGDIDLLYLSNDRFFGAETILLNNGNAVFSHGGFIHQGGCLGFYTVAAEISTVGIGDFNNDGSVDIIFDNYEAEQVPGCNCTEECFSMDIRKNNGHGIFSYHDSFTFSGRHPIMCTGDINNDGLVDVICDGLIMRGHSDGYFQPVGTNIQGNTGIAGDFESDGDIDVITLSFTGIKLYKNFGDGSFADPESFSTGSDPTGICAANFDGDCDLDIATTDRVSNNVIAIYNSEDVSAESIGGPETIEVGSESVLYSSSEPGGYWEIFNNPPCNAMITGSNENNTVSVNAGAAPGVFILYYHLLDDCGWRSFRKEVSIDNPMPVELASFISLVNNNNVLLKWTTASETNNSGFDVERSDVKGQTSDEWINIGHVSGNGTTSTPKYYEFTDRGVNTGKYNYRLKQVDYNGNYEYYNLSNEVVIGAPDKFSLSQNYPNPFNPVTNLEFGISNLEFVSLKVYDMLGKEVATIVNENLNAGTYKYSFNAGNLTSGIYFYKIKAGNFSEVKRMLLVK